MRRFRLACTGFPSSADYRSFLVRGKKYFLGSAKYGDPDTGERIRKKLVDREKMAAANTE